MTTISTYFNEEEHNQHLTMIEEPFIEEGHSYHYDIYSTDLNADQLRKTIFFLQSKAKQPQYAFILDCVEWGLEETYTQGIIRFKTPENKSHKEHFNEIILTLEHDFKQQFTMSSGAGFGLVDDFNHIPKTQQSIFSFAELQEILSSEDYHTVMDQSLPYLAYHTYLDEAIEHVISQQGKTNSPIFWVFVSLLAQHKELFNAVYVQAENQLHSLDEQDIVYVKDFYVSSYHDGQQIDSIVNKHSHFTEFLQSHQFFNDYLA